jgi:hypothetical protein
MGVEKMREKTDFTGSNNADIRQFSEKSNWQGALHAF